MVEGIAPVSNEKEWTGKYTTEQPEEGWEMVAFNDSTWAQGSAAFGTEGGPSVGTPWNTNRLWIRREVSFDPSLVKTDNFLCVIRIMTVCNCLLMERSLSVRERRHATT